ncbi:PA2169 family four-helix-bundle protein [Pseudomonas cichorii]|uniref:ferritin-like domain-containing protein n=1 Tax=Pseudomonas cichorii TaxID=36746 RepID=UPI001C8685FB|nr:PA2169 family four-helix-bundle protein [Pseudomonas cichorii]MBX8487229.1 PA2169 family four-helix-bundle protein [Pseudomonas cichorii]MBX8497513.1 PA2169 family four-helix-bundle protein [Pseudomonas cichorii]MBX8508818.1 PA2169 family four-helix-bundle protein [Pseudomonas cichorii]MBX8515261.1 PA2169 family four-helix-bundle protein [Pseudomonas cichorii]MBX8523522.1 PA2169 family four-helix-bundle protein [Pseudomonas cichorii]
MTDVNKESIDLLNDLIETSKDGQKGFETSAEDLKNPLLKSFFQTRASECGVAVSELQAEVRSLGGEPETSSSAAGSLHRVWVDLKAALTGQSDEAILNEVERGEDHALAAYKKALEKAQEKSLPANVVALVRKQLDGTQRNHDKVKSLRDQVRRAS